jgi:Tol biopolymer transport system component
VPVTGFQIEMDPKRWQQIDRLLEEALDREPGQRAIFLAQACGSDTELRRAVEELIAAHEQAGSFGERPAIEVVAQAIAKGPSRSLVGKRLGPYEILSLVQRGGMGEVYRVRDTRLDRIDALKILPEEIAADPERIRRFVREARAASALNHPNVATIYEIGESDGIHWIAMEFVEGETLAERIKGVPQSLDSVLAVGIQVSEGLKSAHGRGIIHRDIKPSNLMLTPEGQVKILDFGLARRVRVAAQATACSIVSDPPTAPGVVMGTARYMSPEQVLGQPVDHRTDLFSLGAVLYEMATGRSPFAGGTFPVVFSSIVHEKVSWPPQVSAAVPPELRQIIEKSLEKFREMRYQSASDLCADLKRLKHGMERPEAAAGPVVAAPLRGKHRKRIGAAIAILILTGAGILWYGNRRPAPPPVEVPNAVPLTAYPGVEDEPTLSPDDSQVAFTWTGESGDNSDIYDKVIGSEPPVRLTTYPGRDYSPAWSPDGRWIAFCRDLAGEKTALILIPPIGGQERILTETPSHRIDVRSPFLAWMPDSRSLVETARDNIEEDLFLLSIETRGMKKLTTGSEDSLPAVSPDGSRLAFCRWTSWANSDLYLLELSGNPGQRPEPRRLTFEYASAVWSAWSADGHTLLFSVGKSAEANLYRTDLSAARKPQRLVTPNRYCTNPATPRQGNRLVYAQWTGKSNLWRMEMPSPHQKMRPPEMFVATNRFDSSPRFSPDGKRVAFISDRSGTYQIWICHPDGSNLHQLTSLGKGHLAWYLPWSPDSRRLTFYWHGEGSREVYSISADGGAPQRLTTTPSQHAKGSANSSWSIDGRWILFDRAAGDRRGGVWKVPASGGDPVQLITDGWSPVESPDGRFVYYLGGETTGDLGIWRVPTEGGTAQRVLGSVDDNENYAFVGNEIYFIPRPDAANNYSIECMEVTTGRIHTIATFHRRIDGLTVSPDRRWLMWAQGEYDSDLMLVENFR